MTRENTAHRAKVCAGVRYSVKNADTMDPIIPPIDSNAQESPCKSSDPLSESLFDWLTIIASTTTSRKAELTEVINRMKHVR